MSFSSNEFTLSKMFLPLVTVTSAMPAPMRPAPACACTKLSKTVGVPMRGCLSASITSRHALKQTHTHTHINSLSHSLSCTHREHRQSGPCAWACQRGSSCMPAAKPHHHHVKPTQPRLPQQRQTRARAQREVGMGVCMWEGGLRERGGRAYGLAKVDADKGAGLWGHTKLAKRLQQKPQHQDESPKKGVRGREQGT